MRMLLPLALAILLSAAPPEHDTHAPRLHVVLHGARTIGRTSVELEYDSAFLTRRCFDPHQSAAHHDHSERAEARYERTEDEE